MIILYLVGLYLIAGLVFAVPFLSKWVTRLDEGTQDAPWTFRITILPGTIVFWPLLVKKLLEKSADD